MKKTSVLIIRRAPRARIRSVVVFSFVLVTKFLVSERNQRRSKLLHLINCALCNESTGVYSFRYNLSIIVSAIAGILLKAELLIFFQINFCDNECLLKRLGILFGSEYKREI